jgi:hypothetical protein
MIWRRWYSWPDLGRPVWLAWHELDFLNDANAADYALAIGPGSNVLVNVFADDDGLSEMIS